MHDFVAQAFGQARLDWRKHVRFDERYLRPSDADAVIGEATNARAVLGWTLSTLALTPELVAIMVEAAIAHVEHSLSGDHARRSPEAAL